jgi:hypothetical protein
MPIPTALIGLIALVLLVAVLARRSTNFRARFERDRDALLARPRGDALLVTEADLDPLPPLMQAYLRRIGVVGRPHVHTMRVTFAAQMRSSGTSPWMAATATQYEFFDPPVRPWILPSARRSMACR